MFEYIWQRRRPTSCKILSAFGEKFSGSATHTIFFGRVHTRMPRSSYLLGLEKKHDVDDRPIAAVMESAFYNRFLDPADSARLAECSVDELVAYLLTHDQPKLTSKLAVLAKDTNLKIRELAFGAAKKIAASSPLNGMRMDGMGLLPKQDDSAHQA